MINFEYVNAVSSNSAVTLLSQNPKHKALAGGTDLIAEIRSGIIAPDRLVNLKTIDGLNGIGFDAKDGLKLGALSTLDDIAKHAAVKEYYPMLAGAISDSASPQLR